MRIAALMVFLTSKILVKEIQILAELPVGLIDIPPLASDRIRRASGYSGRLYSRGSL